MHTLKWNRGEHSESETGKNISIKTISLALLLALDKGGSQAPQGPFFGEGNGTPLEYSCQEDPMDGGAW